MTVSDGRQNGGGAGSLHPLDPPLDSVVLVEFCHYRTLLSRFLLTYN